MAIAKVSQLRQLVGRAGRCLRRCLLDIPARFCILLLHLMHRPLMHRATTDDQVDQHADQRDEQHEHEPQGLGPAGQITAAEDVDEHRDQDPEPDNPQEDLENGPENVQKRIIHSFSFTPGVAVAVPRGTWYWDRPSMCSYRIGSITRYEWEDTHVPCPA